MSSFGNTVEWWNSADGSSIIIGSGYLSGIMALFMALMSTRSLISPDFRRAITRFEIHGNVSTGSQWSLVPADVSVQRIDISEMKRKSAETLTPVSLRNQLFVCVQHLQNCSVQAGMNWRRRRLLESVKHPSGCWIRVNWRDRHPSDEIHFWRCWLGKLLSFITSHLTGKSTVPVTEMSVLAYVDLRSDLRRGWSVKCLLRSDSPPDINFCFNIYNKRHWGVSARWTQRVMNGGVVPFTELMEQMSISEFTESSICLARAFPADFHNLTRWFNLEQTLQVYPMAGHLALPVVCVTYIHSSRKLDDWTGPELVCAI